MSKPVHAMIRVLDEARSVQFYADAFSMSVADRFEFDDFTLIYLRSPESGFELELTVNKGRTQPLPPFKLSIRPITSAFGHTPQSIFEYVAVLV